MHSHRAQGSIVASVSDGTVAIIRGEGEVEVEQSWKAHDYEPWIAAFDYWDTEAIWTGKAMIPFKLI
jgi:diphthamide biosynthesis protein 7